MLKNYIEEVIANEAYNSDLGRYYQIEAEAYSPEENLTAIIKMTIDNDMRYYPATYYEPSDVRGRVSVYVDTIIVYDEDGNNIDYGLDPKDFNVHFDS